MSLVSGVIIGMLEKELASQAPEIEAYALQLLGALAKDVLAYIEKKVGITSISSDPAQSLPSQE